MSEPVWRTNTQQSRVHGAMLARPVPALDALMAAKRAALNSVLGFSGQWRLRSEELTQTQALQRARGHRAHALFATGLEPADTARGHRFKNAPPCRRLQQERDGWHGRQ